MFDMLTQAWKGALPMHVRSLEAHGVQPQLLDVWESELGPDLLPVQQQAVVEHKVLAGQNLLVQAPTTAGKTFIGEMAAAHTLLGHQRCFYMVPLKALAAE